MQPGPCSKNLLSGRQTTCRDWSRRNAKTDSCRYRCRSGSVSSLVHMIMMLMSASSTSPRRVRVGEISDSNFVCLQLLVNWISTTRDDEYIVHDFLRNLADDESLWLIAAIRNQGEILLPPIQPCMQLC
jgi:hypothetical protein